MKNTEQIYEAYLQVVNEAATPKFKVGDQVGIGYDYGVGAYHAKDTRTVTKVNRFGHHTVEYHNNKSIDDPSKPYVEEFDARGNSRDKYSSHIIIPKTYHDSLVKSRQDKTERSNDLASISKHLDDHRLVSGHYSKLSKESAAHMKAMIDKHTSEE